jgi:hypothetical protein
LMQDLIMSTAPTSCHCQTECDRLQFLHPR